MAADAHKTGNRKTTFHQVAHRVDADELLQRTAAANEREERDARRRQLLSLRLKAG